jgi:putative nucleotidyltransferase with HDIG domain
MKTQQFLQYLTEQLGQWRYKYKLLYRQCKLLRLISSHGRSHREELLFKKILDKSRRRKQKPVSKLTAKFIWLGWLHKRRSTLILVVAIASLTGVMGHNLYNQPQLTVGMPAPQTFIAPYDNSVYDPEKTEARRNTARDKSTRVLKIDANVNEEIDQNLRSLLDDGDETRATAGAFPFFDTSVVSILTQRYLRSCPDAEWQQLLLALENWHSSQSQRSKGSPKSDTPKSSPQNPNFTQALTQLEIYGTTTSEHNLSLLITQITQARTRFAQASSRLGEWKVSNLDTASATVFLDLSDVDWAKTKDGIHDSEERIITQGIPRGLPENILQDAVNLQVHKLVPPDAEALATKILLTVLKPNLDVDLEQTEKQAKQAEDAVSDVRIEVHKGSVIVYKGRQITPWNIQVLKSYNLIQQEVNWWGLVRLGVIITAAIRVFVWAEQWIKYPLRQRDRLLVLLLTLSVPGVLGTGILYTSWSALGLLSGSFYGPTLGVTVVVLLVLLLPISLEVSKIGILAGAAGGILGSCIAQRLRSREELALLGVAIAVTQGSIYLLLKVLSGEVFVFAWYHELWEAALFALSGLVWSIVALGLSPYLEKLFDLITPIRLAELANPNRPLLKRLASETPGTFQHTLFVATLAEAAAQELGCNVELVRAGTLYHDIGKMHDPLSFIENQMGGPNKHDTEIKNPWQSAAIIKKHVTEGLVMARKHSLPTAIQAFIPEHQGTMVIAYFYHQAQQMAQGNPSLTVDEADFRYDGPTPQSRETGIVMLADSCEAAMRSLKEGTTEQALTMVNNILRGKWQNDQLVDSGLTREEMSKITEIFVEVWQQFHHKRIAYPKLKKG